MPCSCQRSQWKIAFLILLIYRGANVQTNRCLQVFRKHILTQTNDASGGEAARTAGDEQILADKALCGHGEYLNATIVGFSFFILVQLKALELYTYFMKIYQESSAQFNLLYGDIDYPYCYQTFMNSQKSNNAVV